MLANNNNSAPFVPTALLPTQASEPQIVVATPAPISASTSPEQHIVQPGESLSMIALQYNTTLQTLVSLNELANPDRIEVGQVIKLPSAPTGEIPLMNLMPDNLIYRGPSSRNFDVISYVNQTNGYLMQATDTVTTSLANGAGFDETLSGANVVQRVAVEYSVDPRILLALLEYRSRWVSSANLSLDAIAFPIINAFQSGNFNRMGLYRQLSYAANELNRGYYGFKTRGLRLLEFADGERVTIPTQMNAGTVALLYFLSLNQTYQGWQTEISQQRLVNTYRALFGDPFTLTDANSIQTTLTQPPLQLPFAAGEVWLYTGGPHGGWGNGSAWASVDFAPPDERAVGSAFCYTSQFAVRAVGAGILARSADGAVILDLDGDADEATGWTISYLHLADITAAGTIVQAGEIVGYASCAGGYSNATHLHVGRRYNGEWMPADCTQCLAPFSVSPFVMSEWTIQGLVGQEYQGYITRGSIQQVAEQGRETPINQVSW
jgi:LysM repeat protein